MVGQDANRVKPFTLQFEKRPEYLYAFVQGEKDSYEIRGNTGAKWQTSVVAQPAEKSLSKKTLMMKCP